MQFQLNFTRVNGIIMRTNDRYFTLLFSAFLIPSILWLLSFPTTTVEHHAYPLLVYASQLLAIVGFTLFAISFILTSRIKPIEKYFGGLDKLYKKHQHIGKIAFILLLLHPILLSLRWFPENIEKMFWFLLPLHKKIEVNLGSWALIGLTILLALTIVVKLPYDKWKITHKFMGLIFLVGIIHLFSINNFYANNFYLAIYLSLISIVSLTAFIYKSIFEKWLVKKHPFIVTKIQNLNDQVMEVSLKNSSIEFEYIPGQFCFFQFIHNDISMESHPYTICGGSTEGEIRVLIKSLGDYTTNLHEKLTLNTAALVEGPYGYFDYRKGKNKQVWIAGGVGIAPFISWSRDFKNHDISALDIDFYYCVNNTAEAYHLHEFEKLEKSLPNFHLFLSCSDRTGFINGKDINNTKDRTIYICGPSEMSKSLTKDFKAANIKEDNIIFEDFDFM